MQHFQAGRMQEAEAAFRSVLQASPGQPDALHFLGLIAHQSGDAEVGAELIGKAIQVRPSAPMYCNLGIVLHAQGKLDAAIASYRQAIALSPNQSAPHYYLGVTLAACGDMAGAAQSYQRAIQLDPAFGSAHISLGNVMHHLNRLGEAEASYRAGLGLPDDGGASRSDVLSDLAMVLLKMGRYNEAVVEIKQALALKPESQLYQRNYRALLARLIPPWHFAMLADHARNAAFRKAIEKHCTDAELVLEIGTGSGLLAMMAARAGAKQVVTCEDVPAIAENAMRIIEANGYKERIAVYPTRSTNLVLGRELPRRADVLVAEILSSEIFAEGALDAMADAKERLLQEGAIIIPQAVSVCAALVSSQELRQLTSVQTVEGFDLSLFNEFAPYLITVPMDAALEVVSETFSPFTVSMGERLAEASVQLPIRATRTATVHGIVQWMKVMLDADTVLENAPGAGEGSDHWGAVFHPFPQPVEIADGQELMVSCVIDGTSLRMRLS
jgi:type II protein arginine methyltransferase